MKKHSIKDCANVIAPAPVFFGIAVLTGLLFESFAPSASLLSYGYVFSIGVVLILVSIFLVLSAVLELRRANTAFDARKPTTAIVTGGAFKISRNPTYLSLSLLSIGIALVVPSMWLIATSVIAIGVTHRGVILREEVYLRNKFGESHIGYAGKVRRWL